eukprot:15440472-Alexandrium_andersonii.AAC.1
MSGGHGPDCAPIPSPPPRLCAHVRPLHTGLWSQADAARLRGCANRSLPLRRERAAHTHSC